MVDIEMVERAGKMYPKFTCSKCGNDVIASYDKIMREQLVERRLCFHCNFWKNMMKKNPPTIIDGRIYDPGNRRTGEFRGMGGRRFDIEYFSGPHAGKKITTFDLWAGDEIPEEYRDRLPDTARFLNEAEEMRAGGFRCWNASNPHAEEYPSPRKAGVNVA